MRSKKGNNGNNYNETLIITCKEGFLKKIVEGKGSQGWTCVLWGYAAIFINMLSYFLVILTFLFGKFLKSLFLASLFHTH